MNMEALRLLDALHDSCCSANQWAMIDQLRAILSAQEPTAEHWMEAFVETFVDTRPKDQWKYARNLYRRARELAKQEAK